jgi:uncharacterized protein YcaQ
MTVVERLGSLQFDPLDIAGRNHDLVLHARIAGYRREWTDTLLYRDRRLFEAYNKGLSILPTAELPWHRLTWDRARLAHEGGAFDEHAPLVEELLEGIRRDGPLSSTDVEPRRSIDWYWGPTNQVRALLEALAEAGILGIERRIGNRRVYDLMERLYPGELLAARPAELDQRRHRLLTRYRAHGLLGASGSSELWYGTAPGVERDRGGATVSITRGSLLRELVEQGVLVPVAVDGVRGARHVLADELPMLARAETVTRGKEASRDEAPQPPAVTFLAPLDPLVWDRDFLRACYGFDYVWEVYVPAARRRWGYYVLPLLYGDRLVGRIEPRFDRREGALRVIDLWWEPGFDPLGDPAFAGALAEALEAHRGLGGMRRVVLPRTARHRSLAQAIRRGAVKA